MKTFVLGLGSNLGNRKESIEKSIQKLAENPAIEVEKISSLIETRAVSKTPQPSYLNGALLGKTILTPSELLDVTQEIERHLGRTSKGTGDPRSIDLDILFFDQDLICLDQLTIPHPLLHERAFVLTPLNEIAPDFVHPVLQEKIREIYDRVVGY